MLWFEGKYILISQNFYVKIYHTHYDLCPVDPYVNLLSALDSRNGVMSMRTSPHSEGFVDKQ